MIRVLGRILLGSLALLVLLAGLVLFVVLQGEAALPEAAPPTPDDVVAARSFVREVRDIAGSPTRRDDELIMGAEQMNGVIRLGGRLIPGFRGQVSLGDEVVGQMSAPLSLGPLERWLNLTVAAPPFDEGVRLSRIEIGPLSIPPALALAAARTGANIVIGNRFGDTVLGAARQMRIEDGRVAFRLALDGMGENGVMRGVFGTLRGDTLPGPEMIDRYYVSLRDAMDSGALPASGSFLPYVRFTLAAALDGAEADGLANAYTSAILALTQACGAQSVALVAGGIELDTSERDWAVTCDGLTLNGRTDSRQHFTTAAALQAASNRGFAVAVGEFKELHDIVRAAGFDFSDLAANNSGIRMSNLLMATPAEAWPGLLDRIGAEGDVIVTFDGLPEMMSAEAFEAEYGTVDSEAYRALLDRIEARIDALPLHRPGG